MTRSLTLLTALSRPRMLLALPAAALAVTLAACSSSAGTSAHPTAPKPAATHHSAPPAPTATPKQAGAAHHHAHSAPAAHPTHTANPIPQGNGGDQDSDNNGGPSDGDGNI